MNKKELVKEVSEMVEMSQAKVTPVVDAAFFAIAQALADGEEVSITNFGKFSTVDVPARMAKDPRNGSEVEVEAHRKLKFKASSVLKNAVR